ISHMVLPIGSMGVHRIPNEDPVLGALRSAISEPGFYFFPGMDMTGKASESEQEAWKAKLKQGPSGVLVIHPQGTEEKLHRQLMTEVATNMVSALLAAFLLTRVRTHYPGRLLLVTLLGVFAFVTVNVPYWNWYGFPTDFVTSEAIDHIVGWLLAGLV